MKIRPATPTEYDTCAAMMVRTDPWITLKMDIQQCLSAFQGPCKDVFVAEIQSQPVGFIIIQTEGTFRGYIQTLCVAEEFRGQGVGRKLLEFAEENVRTYSVNLFICVSDFNQKALKLYREFGFEQIGLLPDLVKKGFTEILLRKTFGPLMKENQHL
ncbi:MAG: GNAT family N-acetyltransferase [Spirosomataceae bacterium]